MRDANSFVNGLLVGVLVAIVSFVTVMVVSQDYEYDMCAGFQEIYSVDTSMIDGLCYVENEDGQFERLDNYIPFERDTDE